MTACHGREPRRGEAASAGLHRVLADRDPWGLVGWPRPMFWGGFAIALLLAVLQDGAEGVAGWVEVVACDASHYA